MFVFWEISWKWIFVQFQEAIYQQVSQSESESLGNNEVFTVTINRSRFHPNPDVSMRMFELHMHWRLISPSLCSFASSRTKKQKSTATLGYGRPQKLSIEISHFISKVDAFQMSPCCVLEIKRFPILYRRTFSVQRSFLS